MFCVKFISTSRLCGQPAFSYIRYFDFQNRCLLAKVCTMAEALKIIPTTDDMKIITEGKAHVYFPKNVFYNPVQEFNRDLTIAVISQYSKDLKLERELKLAKTETRSEHGLLKDEFQQTNAAHSRNKIQKNETSDSLGGNKNNQGVVSHDSDDDDISVVLEGKPCDKNVEETLGKPDENGIRILEGLAASGLRSVRFALEIPGVKEIVANDFDENAVNIIRRNIEKNKVEKLVTPSYGDAGMVMYQNRKRSSQFDVIDLDPYGSPSMFLDATVQAVKDGGLLCVTCTDTAVLCGKASETCMAKYGSVSLNAKFCHEMALRIVLHSIQSHASRYSRYIVPLISISADFYVRVFVRVFTGQNKVKDVTSKLSMVFHCTGCSSFHLQSIGTKVPSKGNNFNYGNAIGPIVGKKCAECNGSFHIGGPIWNERIHDVEFIRRVIHNVEEHESAFKTSSRMIGMLNVAMEELQDSPLYYITDRLCGTLHCMSPNLLQMRSAILHAGYEVSMSHCVKNSIKTTAPPSVIWDIMRCWVKSSPVNTKHLKNNTPVKAILEKKAELEANFEVREDANPKSREKKLLRWQLNPEKEWGPKSKASRTVDKESQSTKKKRLQGKRTQKDQGDLDYKQFMCKRFKNGECELGDDCRYSHDVNKTASVQETIDTT